MNTYLLMSTLMVHSLSSNLTRSNYSLCRYFPISRRWYLISKCIFLLLLILLQLLETLGTLALSVRLFHMALDYDIVSVLLMVELIMIFVCSGINMLTAFFGRAFQIGIYTCFGFVGGFCSSLCADLRKGRDVGSLKVWLITLGGSFVFFLISLFLSNVIAKHSNS